MHAETADPSIQNLWKLCGMNTEAGRIMYRYYGSHCKPEVKYPKVKTKTKQQLAEEKKQKETTKKSCPQQAKISYPVPKPKETRHVAAIDLIPKRKPQAAIQEELDKTKHAPLIRPHPGQNRTDMIDKLQEKYQFSSGILPKTVQATPIEFEHSKVHDMPKGKHPVQKKPVVATKHEKTQEEELNELYDTIMEEIEERQEHLEAILKNGKNEQIESRIKGEIASRISELERIHELKKKIKQ